MGRFRGQLLTCLSAVEETGIGTTIDVRDYDHIMLEVAGAGTADLTVKVAGSDSDVAPTFSSAASASNAWMYLGVNNLEDGTIIEGDTGIVFAGTDAVYVYMVNVSALSWLNCNVTAYAAGNVTVKVRGYASNSGKY